MTIDTTQDDFFANNIHREDKTYGSGAPHANWDYGYGAFERLPYIQVYLTNDIEQEYSRHIIIIKARKNNPHGFKPVVVACNGAFYGYEFLEPWADFATVKEAKAYVVNKGYTLIAA